MPSVYKINTTMVLELVTSAILMIVSGIARAFHDMLSTGVCGSGLIKESNTWLNYQDITWRNKYRYSPDKKGLVPRFPLSTTVLVFVTDAWHFFGFLHRNAMILAFAVLAESGVSLMLDLHIRSWIVITAIWATSAVVLNASFELVYRKIK